MSVALLNQCDEIIEVRLKGAHFVHLNTIAQLNTISIFQAI